MNMVSLRPWHVLNDINDEMNQFLATQRLSQNDADVAVCQWSPKVDIREDEDKFLILAELPGIDLNNVEISVDDGYLVLKGEREEIAEDNKKHFVRIESARGAFYRRFKLPENINVDEIAAKGKLGVLEISIPKQIQEKTRRIEVKVE